MSTNFSDVGDFHRKFALNVSGDGPHDVPPDLLEFRRRFLHEELEEFEEGMAEGDDTKMADALIDLVYIAMGTAHLAGYPWEELWNDVQRANMAKVRSFSVEATSDRGGKWDVIKPKGWQPPHTAEILAEHGFMS